MKTFSVLLLLNGVWLGLGFVATSAVGTLLFGPSIEMLPQWYCGLSATLVVASGSALTEVVYARLNRRCTPLPGAVFSPHFTLVRDLLEAQGSILEGPADVYEVLEPLDDDVTVPRVELDQPRRAPALLTSDQGRARARERIENDVAALA